MYELVSDMSTRQDGLEERLSSLEDKIQILQVSLYSGFSRTPFVKLLRNKFREKLCIFLFSVNLEFDEK